MMVRRFALVMAVLAPMQSLSAQSGKPEKSAKGTKGAKSSDGPEAKEKSEREKPAGREINLIPMIQKSSKVIRGKWTPQGSAIISDAAKPSLVMIPYKPPTEYDLELEVKRLKGTDVLALIIPVGENQPAVVLDGSQGKVSGIGRIDGKDFSANESTFNGKVFHDTGAARVLVQVRVDGVRCEVNGKLITEYKGEIDKLSMRPQYDSPHKDVLGLVTYNTSFRIDRFTLTPISGEGRKVKLAGN